MKIEEIRRELSSHSSAEKARILQRFFKTGPGQYGEGDKFLGIQVPLLRKFAKKYQGIPLDVAEGLLHSAIHEERLLALLILILQYKNGDESGKQAIYSLYLKNTAFINNWDLVDVSSEHIVGAHLLNRNRELLHNLATSKSLWERRISILATFHFIRRGDFVDTLEIAHLLLTDREDLIHKAAGWMLREVGKRNLEVEQTFLKQHYKRMPRTMLRYAIEKFPEELRKEYLLGKI